MYLATLFHGEDIQYQIRQSYQVDNSGLFSHRIIHDLGREPRQFIEQPYDNVILFDSGLFKSVAEFTDRDPDLLLENLLWNFLPRGYRDRLAQFDRCNGDPGPMTDQQRAAIDRQIHMFDRRRIYYLYYGAVDQSKIFSMRPPVLRPLLNQSRDEREYVFVEMEKALDPGEYRNYIYAILNLHVYFTASYATYMPEALPEQEVADYFVEALCSLNSAHSFWQHEPEQTWLHPHLVRYMIMFFDYIPRNRSYQNDFIRQFMNDHRRFFWPDRTKDIAEDEVVKLYGQSLKSLKEMESKELSRLYRKKALELHPDQGGDHDAFVELNRIYQLLQKSARN
ncbi:hypothetical protein [Desulfosediminicola sp.]|uniref:hypothetical protein n=1 Tax=Desulfosediminicola sp. TaxID=2886825 RepID=UPI003AF29C50